MSMLTTLGLSPSFGFGDRLGLATPGHISALRSLAPARRSGMLPVFAQQSVRENARTGRTPAQVLEDARRAVDAAGWDLPWGADADHLKMPADLAPFVQAGYTFFTVDPGEHVDNAASSDPLKVLEQKARHFDLDRLCADYLGWTGEKVGIRFERETLLRAAVKYGKAIEHAATMYTHLAGMLADFDFEVSVDETDTATSPEEHYFIASELIRRRVRFTSLAPRFLGRFEKGVDYIGNLQTLNSDLARHAAVTAFFGSYKISLHSGSDKFLVYPLLVRHWGRRIHVKTAGTSYLEALRTVANFDPALFRKIYAYARERYPEDRVSYHVSADLDLAPLPEQLQDGRLLLDQFDARQILHVTYGSVLTATTETGDLLFYPPLLDLLRSNQRAYSENLSRHFLRHLSPFVQE